MPEQAVVVHGVPGPPVGPGPGEIAGGLKVGHDGLDGAVGEPDDGADIPDPGAAVPRILEITGIDRVLPRYDSVAEALACIPAVETPGPPPG